LENVVERAMVLAEGPEIGADGLSAEVRAPRADAHPDADDLSVKRRTQALERELIARALEQTGGNRTRAAKLLEVSHRTLLYKLREYGLGD
jgi:two-component system response regulator AtoC